MNHNVIKLDQFELHLSFRNGSRGKIINVENSYIWYQCDKNITIKVKTYKKFDSCDYDFINSISRLYSNTMVFNHDGEFINVCRDVYESKYLKECHYTIFLHLVFREIEELISRGVRLFTNAWFRSKLQYNSLKLNLMNIFGIKFNPNEKHKYSIEYLNSVFINFDQMSEEDQCIILSTVEATEILGNSYLRSMTREEVRQVVKEEIQMVVKEELQPMIKEEVRQVVKEEIQMVVKEELQPMIKEEVRKEVSRQLVPVYQRMGKVEAKLDMLIEVVMDIKRKIDQM